jgi:quinolinate synthase
MVMSASIHAFKHVRKVYLAMKNRRFEIILDEQIRLLALKPMQRMLECPNSR